MLDLGKVELMAPEARSSDFDAIMALYRQLQPDDPALATAYLNVIPNITRSASPYAVIGNVVVDAELRGKGFGKELMSAVLERACQLDSYPAKGQSVFFTVFSRTLRWGAKYATCMDTEVLELPLR